MPIKQVSVEALSPNPSERGPADVLPSEPDTKQTWSNSSDLEGLQGWVHGLNLDLNSTLFWV